MVGVEVVGGVENDNNRKRRTNKEIPKAALDSA